MTPASSDRYWDELGIAWCAIDPQANVIMPRLRSRLRRQSWLIMGALICGLPLSIAGLFLGGFTIWRGWTTATWNFVTRGFAILVISTLVSAAWSRLISVRAGGYARALSEMIDLAISRSERALVIVKLGLYACAVAAVLGLLGTAIRIHLANPPALSPIIDLVVLIAFATGLYLYGRHTRINLEKFRHLKHAIATEEEKPDR